MRPDGWIFLCALTALPQAALAQQAGGRTPLTETQKTGRLLYEQSCGICHVKPHLVAPVYGPQLSQETLEGKEDLIRAFIANGSARMPGFSPYSCARFFAVPAICPGVGGCRRTPLGRPVVPDV